MGRCGTQPAPPHDMTLISHDQLLSGPTDQLIEQWGYLSRMKIQGPRNFSLWLVFTGMNHPLKLGYPILSNSPLEFCQKRGSHRICWLRWVSILKESNAQRQRITAQWLTWRHSTRRMCPGAHGEERERIQGWKSDVNHWLISLNTSSHSPCVESNLALSLRNRIIWFSFSASLSAYLLSLVGFWWFLSELAQYISSILQRKPRWIYPLEIWHSYGTSPVCTLCTYLLEIVLFSMYSVIFHNSL